MSESAEFVNRRFEERREWSYAYAFGILHSYVRGYLKGNWDRNTLTAVIAVVDMHRQRHIDSIAPYTAGEVDLDLGVSTEVERREPGGELT